MAQTLNLPGVSDEAVTAVSTLLNSAAKAVALTTNQKAINAVVPTTVTSGAIPVTSRTTFLSITSTVGFTLADGTFEGQKKTIRCTVAASTPVGTVTPATASGFTSFVIKALEGCAELEWHAGGWVLVYTKVFSIT